MDLPEQPPEENAPSASSSEDSQTSESFYKQLQVLTTFVTLVVAVTAIGLPVWEGYETRQYNRLTVQPYLKSNSVTAYSRTADGVTGELTYELESNGLGPAVYTKILMYQRTDDSWRFLRETTSDGGSIFPNTDGSFLARLLSQQDESASYISAPLMQGFSTRKGKPFPFSLCP